MFFKDQANTEIYTLSLHDALPISGLESANILEKLSMKLGADNPKKVIITAALTVFALALFIYMVFSGSGPGTASASATQPGTATPAAESHQAAHDAAVRVRVNSSLDPSLRTDRLRSEERRVGKERRYRWS